jgi:hypothetical protein
MAYTSEPQDPMGDAYMEDFSFTNEMLSPGFSTITSRGGTSFSDPTSIATLGTTVPDEEQKADMQSILDIFQLDEEPPDQSDENELDEDDIVQELDLEDQRQRTERLRGVYAALDRLWWMGSEYMVGAAEKLADGSRDRKLTWILTSHRSLIPKYMTPILRIISGTWLFLCISIFGLLQCLARIISSTSCISCTVLMVLHL